MCEIVSRPTHNDLRQADRQGRGCFARISFLPPDVRARLRFARHCASEQRDNPHSFRHFASGSRWCVKGLADV